jgi:hypothetical protein
MAVLGGHFGSDSPQLVGMLFSRLIPEGEADRMLKLVVQIEQRQFRLAPNRVALRQFREDGGFIYHS